MEKKLKVILLGLGTVGSGVYELIESNPFLNSKVDIVKILVSNPNKKRNVKDLSLVTNQVSDLDFSYAQIMIETIGGVKIAYDLTKKALSLGISVITSNKELVNTYGKSLFKLAALNHCYYLYEASVLAGIPVVNTLHQIALSDQIESIEGIFNGSTNYCLTKVFKDGKKIQDVILEAKALGYLEENPDDDMMGYDALRKVLILSKIAFKTEIDETSCIRRGIEQLSEQMINYAKANDLVLKLIAHASLNDHLLSISVMPTLFNKNHPLSQIDYEFNQINVKTTSRGLMTWIGKGAGKLPTAQGILSDLTLLLEQKPYITLINPALMIKTVMSKEKSCFILEMTKDVLPKEMIDQKHGNIYKTVLLDFAQIAPYLNHISFYAKVGLPC